MEKILLLLESDAMQDALTDSFTNFHVQTCGPGEATDVLANFRPDALILDLFLPGTDGFTILESCEALLPPVILLLSVLDSEYVRKRAVQLGVDFIIQKPCPVDYIVHHLSYMLMTNELQDFTDNNALVEYHLNPFYIHAKERVLEALGHAILMCAEDPDCLLTKEIYAEVCKNYGTSTDGVDQAIRRALRNAWSNRQKHPAAWEQFFPDYDRCPSNGVFIAALAAWLHKKYPSRFRKGSRLS